MGSAIIGPPWTWRSVAFQPGEEAAFVEVLAASYGRRPSAELVAGDVADLAELRCWVALAAGRPIGVAAVVDLRVTMPGGARLPLAGVTEVWVLPTHRRRGVLRRLMEALLTDARGRGDPVAGLMATEAPIYGRFSFGVADRVPGSRSTPGAPPSASRPLRRVTSRSATGRPPGPSCPSFTSVSAPCATGGMVEELTPGAVARATAMFRWSPLPWCGDFF